MKLNQSNILLGSILSLAMAATSVAQAPGGKNGAPPPPRPAPAGAYTSLSGTVSQFNYSRDGEVDGFLLNNKTLVNLPPASRFAASIHSGDSVQVKGYAQTSPSGFQTIDVQELQDRTSGKTLAVPQPGPGAPDAPLPPPLPPAPPQ
jgi:hypothetical protein